MLDQSTSKIMRDNRSLALIEKICLFYEAADKPEDAHEDANFAAEIMRVIRAIAVDGKVTLLATGPAAELLRKNLAGHPVLWSIVQIADES